LKLQNNANEFNGKAYIGGVLEIPGDKPTLFKSDVYVHGLTTIDGAVTFEKDAYFNDLLKVNSSKAKFEEDVHVERSAVFQNYSATNPIIDGKISVAGDLKTGNTDFKISGNTYVGGDIDLDARIVLQANSTFAYTSNMVNSPKVQYNNNYRVRSTADANATTQTSIKFEPNSPTQTYATKTPPANEPQMNINKLGNVKRFGNNDISTKNAAGVSTGNQFSLEALQTLYNDNLNTENLFDGGFGQKFIVVEITSDMTFSTSNPNTFNGNVIFVVKDGGGINAPGTFPTINGNALVYVGPSSVATPNKPKVLMGANGAFNGLIYIDEGNTCTENEFKWGSSPNSVMNGAVHNFSTQPFRWNTGGTSAVPINFDKNVLKHFSKLYDVPGAGGGSDPDASANVVFKDSVNVGTRITLTPWGFYFR
jgi:hypothetical protein